MNLAENRWIGPAIFTTMILSGFIALAGNAAVACYDPKSPNLPPCDGSERWPDPCAPPSLAADAGRDR
jgi:hypothetical protein